MTNKNYTHLVLVVDRSSSMNSTKESAQAGINELLETQFAQEGKFTVTITQFDSYVDNVVRMADELPEYELQPRGMTALYDAIGYEIHATGADLRKLKEKDRPANVIFMIVTDGGENVSTQYDLAKIKKLTAQQRDEYSWEIQFIGADEHALQGRDIGVATTRYAAANPRAAYDVSSVTLSNLRSGAIGSYSAAMPASVN